MSNAEVGSLPSPLSADKQLFGAILIMRALMSSLDLTGNTKGDQQLGLPHCGQVSARRVCPDRLRSRPPGAMEATHVGGHRDMVWGCGMQPACQWGQAVANPPHLLCHCKGGLPMAWGVRSRRDHRGHQAPFKSKPSSNSSLGRARGVPQTPQTSFGGEGSYIWSAMPQARWRR